MAELDNDIVQNGEHENANDTQNIETATSNDNEDTSTDTIVENNNDNHNDNNLNANDIQRALDGFMTRLDSFEKQLKQAQAAFIENGGTVIDDRDTEDDKTDFRDISDVRNLDLF